MAGLSLCLGGSSVASEAPNLHHVEESSRAHLLGDSVDFDVVYKADILSNVAGGLRRGTTALSNLDVKLLFDADKLFGWKGATFFIYGLSNLGGKPNAHYAGTAQGIDNIEVSTNTAKLYQAWVQQALWQDRLSFLFGLYDLNSEFYVTDTSSLFLHPSPGIGPEFSQTGINGPSIFPTTSLALRAKAQLTPDFYVQGAVFDGVPGDPDNPRGTHIQLNGGDGALMIAEAGYLHGDHGQAILSDRDRDDKARQLFGKYAVGIWSYTGKFDDLVDTDAAGDPLRRGNNRGAYVLAEQALYHEPADATQGLTMFVRYGVANDAVNRFDSYLQFGAVYTGLFPGRNTDQFGLSLGRAHNGDKYRQAEEIADTPTDDNETDIELTYRAYVTHWLAVQPNLQYIINPNTDPQLDDALVMGVRLEFILEQ